MTAPAAVITELFHFLLSFESADILGLFQGRVLISKTNFVCSTNYKMSSENADRKRITHPSPSAPKMNICRLPAKAILGKGE